MIKREFSWSPLSCKLFSSCERAYFYYYHGSWNGWDRYADERTRQLYRLKNLKNIDSWTNSVIKKSLREVVLNSGRTASGCGRFVDMVLHLFRTEWNDFVRGEWRDDPKKLNLSEFSISGTNCNCGELKDKAESMLCRKVSSLTGNRQFCEIFDLPYLGFMDFCSPDSFLSDGIKVWVAPDLIWIKDEMTYVLNIDSGKSADSWWALRSGVNILYLLKKLTGIDSRCGESGAWRKKIIPVTFFSGNGTRISSHTSACRNLKEIKNIIRESSAEILSRSNTGTSFEEENFVCSSSSACMECVFRNVCSF